MKPALLLAVAFISLTTMARADDRKANKTTATNTKKEVEWISFEEAEKRMQKQPRKVWIDIYTGWCGWCKVLDKKVLSHPEVVKYLNEKFYSIKFDAERQDSFVFTGKKWGFMPEYRANGLAVQLMGGQMSYPTSIMMTEGFENPTPIGGYKPVEQMEMFMKYVGDDIYKTVKFEDYMKDFKPSWKEIPEPVTPATLPAGH